MHRDISPDRVSIFICCFSIHIFPTAAVLFLLVFTLGPFYYFTQGWSCYLKWHAQIIEVIWGIVLVDVYICLSLVSCVIFLTFGKNDVGRAAAWSTTFFPGTTITYEHGVTNVLLVYAEVVLAMHAVWYSALLIVARCYGGPDDDLRFLKNEAAMTAAEKEQVSSDLVANHKEYAGKKWVNPLGTSYQT